MTSPRRVTGLTRIETTVIILAGLFLAMCLLAAPPNLRRSALRTECAANLSRIGKAMLAYANDNDGALPRAGGRTTGWGGCVFWNAPDRCHAFGIASDGGGGQGTINSCFYLLVKYGYCPTSCFLCPSDAEAVAFRLSDLAGLPEGFSLADAWTFGPEPYRHCSFAYHYPFGLYTLTTSHEPGMPVAADRNPWQRSPIAERPDIGRFRPDMAPFNGSREQARMGNSTAHGRDGQNVLFLDGHVSFEERSWCGLDADNVYLASTNPMGGSPVGDLPRAFSAFPTNRRDSFLINDPPVDRVETALEAEEIDSKDLERTVLVPTLDCPLPEHRNVVWCATFQMAWDRLKDDVIGAPIQLPEAADLADRLNQAQFPRADVEEQSYYAFAGPVSEGAIEQIQREMRSRFPSEPVPVFDSRYTILPDVVVAFAYLNVDVGFAHPYYAHEGTFRFRGSAGVGTDVTAFSAQCSDPFMSAGHVRDQVEIVCWKHGETAEGDEFAVDLCRYTRPYQVVLARMPRGKTLGDTAEALKQAIAKFPSHPNYETLHHLREIDTLIVPDVLFKLTHRFEELLDKCLGNPGWRLHFFFEAMQKIDFTLSRTGITVRSEARAATASGRPMWRYEPRRLHFDEPFLICVKKREPDATPFFVMWVDNPELMRPYESAEPENR